MNRRPAPRTVSHGLADPGHAFASEAAALRTQAAAARIAGDRDEADELDALAAEAALTPDRLEAMLTAVDDPEIRRALDALGGELIARKR